MRAAGLAVCVLLALPLARARADTSSDFRLRTTGAVGYVVSADQHAVFNLELPVLEGRAHFGWVVLEPLVLEVAVAGGAYFASEGDTGALLDATLGAEVGAQEGPARLWLSAHVGAGLTGTLVRPVLRLALGADMAVDDTLSLGPTVGYTHVFQDDRENATDDAIALSVGLTLTVRPRLGEPSPPAAPPPPPPPARTRVLRAPTPDPAPPPVPTEELMDMLDEAAGLAPRELLVPVLFAFDSTDIVPCTMPSLYRLREHLAAHPELEELTIEGHADGQGDAEYNNALGLARAEAIRDWLVEHGIAPERLEVASRGEQAPMEGNESDEERFQNRRARFLVTEESR
ncbi:MAG: OmpA family protein [Sandaracinaceae bacterium]